MSPSSALSSPKKAPEQLSLARALTVENDPRLKQGLAKDKIMKVDSINASARVMSKREHKRYDQMKLYREALQLPKPTSQSCPCRHSCTLGFYLLCICFLLLLQVFPVLCKIVIIDISCACSSVLEKE